MKTYIDIFYEYLNVKTDEVHHPYYLKAENGNVFSQHQFVQ